MQASHISVNLNDQTQKNLSLLDTLKTTINPLFSKVQNLNSSPVDIYQPQKSVNNIPLRKWNDLTIKNKKILNIFKEDISILVDLENENYQENVQNSKINLINSSNNPSKTSQNSIKIKSLYGENSENDKISHLQCENYGELNFLNKRRKFNNGNL